MSDRMTPPYADEYEDDDEQEPTGVTPWMPLTEARMTVELTSLLVEHAANLEAEGRTAMARVYRRHAKEVARRYRARLREHGRSVQGPPAPLACEPVPEVTMSHEFTEPANPGPRGVGRCSRCSGTRRAHDPAFYAQRDAEWTRWVGHWSQGVRDGERSAREGNVTYDERRRPIEPYGDGWNVGWDNVMYAKRAAEQRAIWGDPTPEERHERFMDLVDQLGVAAYQYEGDYR